VNETVHLAEPLGGFAEGGHRRLVRQVERDGRDIGAGAQAPHLGCQRLGLFAGGAEGEDDIMPGLHQRPDDARANQGNAAYAASKAALEAYMRTLSLETARRGITVNTIAPGFVDTDMMGLYAKYRAGMEKQIPAGRFAQPADIGALAAFLMSPAAAYITGATIPVDGGLMASMGLQR